MDINFVFMTLLRVFFLIFVTVLTLLNCTALFHFVTIFPFIVLVDGMELETLYQRYCIRLKHALFLSGLTVSTLVSIGILITTCVLQAQVSKPILSCSITNKSRVCIVEHNADRAKLIAPICRRNFGVNSIFISSHVLYSGVFDSVILKKTVVMRLRYFY